MRTNALATCRIQIIPKILLTVYVHTYVAAYVTKSYVKYIPEGTVYRPQDDDSVVQI